MDTEAAATVSSAVRNMSPGWRVHCARHELAVVNPMTTEVEIPIPTGVAKEERGGGCASSLPTRSPEWSGKLSKIHAEKPVNVLAQTSRLSPPAEVN